MIGRNILLIEIEQNILRAIEYAIEDAECRLTRPYYNIIAADEIKEALKSILARGRANTAIDLVAVDVRMAGSESIKLVNNLDFPVNAIPLLIISVDGDMELFMRIKGNIKAEQNEGELIKCIGMILENSSSFSTRA